MRDGARIAVVAPYPAEEGKIHGGVQAVTYYLTEGLAGLGRFEVHAVTQVKGISEVIERVTPAGARVHLIPQWGKLNNLTRCAIDKARIRKALRAISPDIVHVHTQTVYPQAALRAGYPSVLTPHGVFYKEARLKTGLKNYLRGSMGVGMEASSIRMAEHLILLNHYLEESFSHLLGGGKIHFIDNPIDDRFFEIHREEVPGTILFIGTAIPRKGLMHIAEAAEILKDKRLDFKFHIVGPASDPAYLQSVRAFVSQHNLDERFAFLGLVSEDEVMAQYARCSILALPSYEETAPMAISQAQAAGMPAVASAVGGVPDMVIDGETGYTVPPRDPVALAEKLAVLLTDTEARHAMGENARRMAERRYRRSIVVEKTIAVYDEVLADAAREKGS